MGNSKEYQLNIYIVPNLSFLYIFIKIWAYYLK